MQSQNAHQQMRGQQQQPGFLFTPPANPSLDSSFLDSPQVAKQMAALTAANQARIAQNSRIAPAPAGTSSGPYFGAINNYPPGGHDLSTANGHANSQLPNNYGLPQSQNPVTNPSLLDSPMSQPNSTRNQPPNNATKGRQQNFLAGLANLMAKRGTPLPPSLTGIPSSYDPSRSPWTIIEPSTEIGSFKLAGKDVDLFKLWGLVFQNGGGHAVSNANGWGSILHHFDLPEEFPQMQANNSASVALMLSQYYMVILHPFEELYKKNLQEQQKKAQIPQRLGGMSGNSFPGSNGVGRPAPGMPNMEQLGVRQMNANGLMPHNISSANSSVQYPQMHSQARPTSTQSFHQIPAPDSHSSLPHPELESLASTVDSNLLDQDVLGIKRKHDQEERETKRARQKTDPPDGSSLLTAINSDVANGQVQQVSRPLSNANDAGYPRQQPSRRKLEYVPLAQEIDTYGGRDVQALDAEWMSVITKRPLRDINDWGVVDIECLCMSIRSRLSVELSYALTTFTVLSTMRGQSSTSGFPIFQCPDLLDDALDLMEELAFVEPEKTLSELTDDIFTNRELMALVQDKQCYPFAVLEGHQGAKDVDLGPQQRPGNIIFAIVNIIRNLTIFADNVEFISNHPRLVDILLRLCTIEHIPGQTPTPASKALSLLDLLLIRRDVMNVLMGIAGSINLSQNSSSEKTLRVARRAFNLLASYLVDPIDSVPPLASVQLAGVAPNPNRKPPVLADTALEVFTRFTQMDANRQIVTKAVPSSSLWLLLENLVHRLPLVDADFILMQREHWLCFVEKTVMAIYSLVFLAPYEMKRKIKTDRTLGFKNVMLRMAQKILAIPTDGRLSFVISARRAIEAMKLLDKSEELVDTSEPTMPVLSFGMGFSDSGDAGMEKGTGMLGGNREVAWDMLMTRDVFQDDFFFNELDSMVRVEFQ